MSGLRKLLFWCHLTTGLTAGVVILVMSVTGALLAFESQILAMLERRVRHVQIADSDTGRIDAEQILAAAAAYKSDSVPTGLTLSADRTASAAVVFGRVDTVYVNPYTGEVLGVGASRARVIFQTLTSWHRWLGVEGPGRA